MKEALVDVQNLKKHFFMKMGFFKTVMAKETPVIRAVDNIDLTVRENETFGLVGESGSGKTTLGRLLLRLIEPTDGTIFFDGVDITCLRENDFRKMRRKMQMILQDPYESLNPRMSVYDLIAEPLRLQKALERHEELEDRVKKTLEEVGLTPPDRFLFRFPHELSGGQRQRIAIGRVFVLRPKFVVADEPVSMLDASVRGEVLKLMRDLTEKYGCTFLYITHDLALSRIVCNRLAVMYFGKIVEMGKTEEIIKNPANPYTKALISAVLVPDPDAKKIKSVVKGEIPSPLNPPSGCRFHPRCPHARQICKTKEPALMEIGSEHYVACQCL